MVMSVNTNVLSLSAQRAMNTTQGALATSIERLSTGLRINSAKDDAAGLAISERFTSSIKGLNQAVRNASDGISFAQVAEGALDVIGRNLQRVRELAVQSLNDSNTDENRAAIDEEVQQLTAEIDRIAKETTFNNRLILDGSTGVLNFQIGAERGEALGLSGVDARASTLGQTFTVATGSADLSGSFTLSGSLVLTGGSDGSEAVSIDLTGVTTSAGVLDAINGELANTGIQASLNSSNQLVLADSSGETFGIAQTGTGANVLSTLGLSASATSGSVDFRSVSEVNVKDRDAANSALAVLDTAIDQATSLRASFGAVQNRFENVIEIGRVQEENLSAARSRIRDADYAAETAALTRAQILQQAGLASLAQANAAPQSVLSLLG
jgi:flagellin